MKVNTTTYAIRFAVRDNLPYSPEVVLPSVSRSLPDPPRKEGAIYIPDFMPKTVDHHTVLGAFVDQWGMVESHVSFLFRALLGADIQSTTAVFEQMGMLQVLDALRALGTMKLTDAGIAALVTLIERASKLNSKRNIIVHGTWYLELMLWVYKGEVRVSSHLLRMTHPDDFRLNAEFNNPRNQKVRARYSFTVKRITAAIRDAMNLVNDLSEFTRSVNDHRMPEGGMEDQQYAHFGFLINKTLRAAFSKPRS